MPVSDGSVSVKFESVQQVEDRIATAIKALTSRLDTLSSELSPIVQFWTGDAQVAYQGDKKKWDDAANDMTLVLGEIKQAVSAAHEEYVRVNNQTKAMF